jgi:LmbE family N-acetylglucosaminyl deacetylase
MPFPSRCWCPALLGTLIPLVLNPAAATELLAPKAILHELNSFRSTGTVLHVGAHPDDENTELITWLSLGRGYRTGYLSMTRGDGGQNELGPEFGEKLGLLRTQELLAARRLDGGRQFFTRAIDFGYSKTPEETLRFWDHDQVLSDVVRVIRQFRPDVIVTRFPIPPGSGGHGHHTASAILAVEAFKLAGDPKAFPEQLKQGLTVWQPKRVLWNSFRFGNAPQPLNGPTFQTDIAGTDEVTGESFGAIAARSRSMHKTQGLGGFTSRVGKGPNMQSFMLLAGLPGDGPGQTPAGQQAGTVPLTDLMDGVDTTWARVPGGAEITALVDAAIAQFKADDPSALVPALLVIRAKLASLPVDPLVTDKRAQLDRILQSCLGLSVQTTIARADVVPGEAITLHHSATVTSDVPVRWLGVRLPDSAPVKPSDTLALTRGQSASRDTATTLSIEASLTQPYWLREDPSPGLYTVTDPGLIGRPEEPTVFPVEQLFEVGGQPLVVTDVPVQPLHARPGEAASRPIEVVGPVSLAWAHPLELMAPGATKTVTVELTAARANVRGTLELEVPAGWKIAPVTRDFHLGAVGERTPFSFALTAPTRPGDARVSVRATVGPRHYHRDRIELSYAHLPVQLLQFDATLHAATFDLSVRARHVGYLPGAGDSVAEVLEQMGCTVRTLTGADLTPEKLAGLDAVVIGVRAFNERADLKAALPGLFAWVEAGGTVIAQYNRPNGLKAGPLGPYPLSIEGPAPLLRVTDETAPVTFLAPDHPALTTPNKITAADFEGWVQERGTYFPSKWDEAHYTAILTMSDPGEAPLRSSLLVARHGKGYYVYAGVAFFRQLPAGVPGAYRLFANLLSLGQ